MPQSNQKNKPEKNLRKKSRLTLLQLMALVILGGALLIVNHNYHWF